MMIIKGTEGSHLQLLVFHDRASCSAGLGFQKKIGTQSVLMVVPPARQPLALPPTTSHPTSYSGCPAAEGTRTSRTPPRLHTSVQRPACPSCTGTLARPPTRWPSPGGKGPEAKGSPLGLPICLSRSAASSGVARGRTPGSLKLVRSRVPITKKKRMPPTTGMAGVIFTARYGQLPTGWKGGWEGEGEKKGNIMSVINSEWSIFSKKPNASLEEQN